MQLSGFHFKQKPFAIKHFVTSYLLASVIDFRVKHNKSTVPCVVSFTYCFYKIDLPSEPSLGSRPIKQCVFFRNGWPVIKSLAQSV